VSQDATRLRSARSQEIPEVFVGLWPFPSRNTNSPSGTKSLDSLEISQGLFVDVLEDLEES
jgi:hypothetical protein